MNGLYKDIILDHYRYPRNQGVLSDAHCVSAQYNPSCGDSVSMTAYITESVIIDIRFEAKGCAICVASASLLSEKVQGMTLAQAQAFDSPAMLNLLGMPLGPTRMKCGLLALYALHSGIEEYLK